MGNPTNYMGAGMTWDVKGNLTSVKNRNGKSASYTYLSDGQRYTRTTGGKKTTYLYNNGLLLSETTGNEVISYYYDSDGTILGIGYKKGSNPEKNYFFEKNAFGDVIAVYRNSDSLLIGTYEYDLWGNPVSVKEAAAGRDTDGILGKNPFRYRCYYYDMETGFYYLNSRYYDPQIRRFISADSITTNTKEDVFGYNLYSYCNNSPLNKTDSDGHFPKPSTILWGIAIGAFIIAAVLLIAGTGGFAGGAFALAGGGIWGSGAAATAAASNAALVGVGAAVAAESASIMESSGNKGYNKHGQQKGKVNNDFKEIKDVYNSINESPDYPERFKGIQNGTTKNTVKNKELLDKLREIKSGTWKKIYKDGYDAYGNEVSIHYFQSEPGKVYDVKVVPGWSN